MGGRFGEIVLIFILGLLFFGPNKLPDMAKSMGQALNEFKKAANPDPAPNNQQPQPQTQQPVLMEAAPSRTRRTRKAPARRKKATKSSR